MVSDKEMSNLPVKVANVLILLLVEHITNFRISEQPWWHHVSERRHKVTKYAATVQLLPPKKRQMPATL